MNSCILNKEVRAMIEIIKIFSVSIPEGKWCQIGVGGGGGVAGGGGGGG